MKLSESPYYLSYERHLEKVSQKTLSVQISSGEKLSYGQPYHILLRKKAVNFSKEVHAIALPLDIAVHPVKKHIMYLDFYVKSEDFSDKIILPRELFVDSSISITDDQLDFSTPYIDELFCFKVHLNERTLYLIKEHSPQDYKSFPLDSRHAILATTEMAFLGLVMRDLTDDELLMIREVQRHAQERAQGTVLRVAEEKQR